MRLIDADKLRNGETLCKVFSNPTDEFYGMLQLIDAQPTIDAVEIIRCKDCEHRDENCCVDSDTYCEITHGYMDDNDYCIYGKLKGGAE